MNYITYMIEVAGILGEISWVWVEILMMTVLVIIVATKQQGLVLVLVCHQENLKGCGILSRRCLV